MRPLFTRSGTMLIGADQKNKSRNSELDEMKKKSNQEFLQKILLLEFCTKKKGFIELDFCK